MKLRGPPAAGGPPPGFQGTVRIPGQAPWVSPPPVEGRPGPLLYVQPLLGDHGPPPGTVPEPPGLDKLFLWTRGLLSSTVLLAFPHASGTLWSLPPAPAPLYVYHSNSSESPLPAPPPRPHFWAWLSLLSPALYGLGLGCLPAPCQLLGGNLSPRGLAPGPQP